MLTADPKNVYKFVNSFSDNANHDVLTIDVALERTHSCMLFVTAHDAAGNRLAEGQVSFSYSRSVASLLLNGNNSDIPVGLTQVPDTAPWNTISASIHIINGNSFSIRIAGLVGVSIDWRTVLVNMTALPNEVGGEQ